MLTTSRVCRLVLLAACVGACKESMHPAPEPDPAPVAEPTPASPPKPKSEPVAAAKSAEPAATTETTIDPDSKKEITSDGYEVIRAKQPDGKSADVAVKAPEGWKVVQPPDSPDPQAGKFTLAQALKGLPTKGTLSASIVTVMGTLQCDLFEDKAPNTVANFVGLARGLRKFWSSKDRAWVARPYYDGTTFHRVIPDFMIQGGDWAGDGSGGIFYTIPDELHPALKHDRAGQLCMANRGPNTNEAQFFITEGAAPHLDGSYTIFGQCTPLDLVNHIARVPQSGPPNNRPLTPVVINHVSIARHPAASGGATPAASAAPPQGHAVQVADPAKPK
jgi:peptidyl-prolyl cis-trans isomerase A (cyclophilin A)